MDFLHPFDAKLERVSERVGDFSGTEGLCEFPEGILDGEAGYEPKLTLNFSRGDVV